MFDRAEHCRQMGHLGGQATVRNRGVEHMRAIGKAGFQSYADEYFGGDRSAAAKSLKGRGKTVKGTRWKKSVRINRSQLEA